MGKFRHLFKVDNVELCKQLRNLDNNQWVKTLLQAANYSLPGFIPEKCPIKDVRPLLTFVHQLKARIMIYSNIHSSHFHPQKIQVLNSNRAWTDEEYESIKSQGFGNLPNGFFKIIVWMFDDIDSNIAKFAVLFENYHPWNSLNFNNF
jgi:hypothetical protein